MRISTYPSTIWKNFSFFIECLGTFVENQLIISFRNLFLCLQLCSIDLYVYPYVTYYINYYSFTVKFNIYTYKPSNFFSCKRLFHNSGFSVFPYKFWMRLTISGKKNLWDFDRVCVECIDQLEESCHLNVYRNSWFFILILYPIA